MSTIVALATQQLAAYNDSNLDAFVACYHADVRVLNGDEVIRASAAKLLGRLVPLGADALVDDALLLGRSPHQLSAVLFCVRLILGGVVLPLGRGDLNAQR